MLLGLSGLGNVIGSVVQHIRRDHYDRRAGGKNAVDK
jgi:hypothetical protein